MTSRIRNARWRRDISLGGNIPSGWRMAWYEPRRRVGVYFPVPLHWLLRLCREIGYRLRLACCAPPIEKAQTLEMERRHEERERLAEEYARGYLEGWRECFETCMEAVEEEITRADEVWEIGALRMRDEDPSRSN